MMSRDVTSLKSALKIIITEEWDSDEQCFYTIKQDDKKNAQGCNIAQQCSTDNVVTSQKSKIAVRKAINYIN